MCTVWGQVMRRMRVRRLALACGLVMGACGGVEHVGQTTSPHATQASTEAYTLTAEQTAAQQRTAARAAYPGERECAPQWEDEVRTSRGTCVAADNLTDQQHMDETGYAR